MRAAACPIISCLLIAREETSLAGSGVVEPDTGRWELGPGCEPVFVYVPFCLRKCKEVEYLLQCFVLAAVWGK